jgi:CRP/FNR family transcriptional regulator, anaerobic regulatory protein
MYKAFEDYIRINAPVSETAIARICSLAVPRKLRRNEALLSAGEVCRNKIFISSGLLRTYSIAEDGSEPILQFSPELSWTLDVESYDTQKPATCYIAAIEPTEVLLWQKQDFHTLVEELPGLKAFSGKLISNSIYRSRERIITALSSTPEEKYEDFARNNPDLLSRVPLRMIAAYLGISIKTLTRLRHAQWARTA